MERPVIFSADMVLAILAGRKTQTRRVVKLPRWFLQEYPRVSAYEIQKEVRCPYGQPGDRLWVRETWRPVASGGLEYRASETNHALNSKKWRSPIFMPRAYSRLTLELTDVRVEQVQEIDEGGAKSEGFQDYLERFNIPRDGSISWYAKAAFVDYWNELHGAGNFREQNPWVWVLTFKIVDNTGGH